ncbi:phage terminase large subunit [Paraburkholderia sp. BR10936]|uniref:phage terminase large subunit n=1 Tax=Paraburkholderia sp. BR10936 TaxID=3236993 RepID=UPI0034D27AF3
MESVVLPFRTNRKPPPAWMRSTTQDAWRQQAIRKACEDDHIAFTSYFFQLREGVPFRLNWHHLVIADAVQKIIDGTWTNVVINVAPGASKTELVVINFIARGLALNAYARFLHISYGDELALLNSQKARELIQSDEYQAMWTRELRDDSRSLKRWNVEVDGRTAGGVYAVAFGGQITGFRAGRMVPGFQGAIILDDPLKIEDAYSKAGREKANRRLVSTVKSRKANPATPIIVIMQRLAVDDCTGFIRAGGLPGHWHYVEIPALIDQRYVEHYAHPYRHCIDAALTDRKGRFSYWPYKEPLEELLALEQGGTNRDGQRISRRVFSAQYQQKPTEEGGNLIKGHWFGRWRVLPHIVRRLIIADTAQKTSERNDFTVFMEWGLGVDGRIYAINLIRDRWEAPDLKRNAIDFWDKCRAYDHRVNVPLAALMVEDKSSGTGLIQEIRRGGRIPILGIPRNRDKVIRVKGAAPSIEAGLVMLPEECDWVSDFVTECEAFTEDDTHAHDDQVDVLCDAVEQLLAEGALMNWV